MLLFLLKLVLYFLFWWTNGTQNCVSTEISSDKMINFPSANVPAFKLFQQNVIPVSADIKNRKKIHRQIYRNYQNKTNVKIKCRKPITKPWRDWSTDQHPTMMRCYRPLVWTDYDSRFSALHIRLRPCMSLLLCQQRWNEQLHRHYVFVWPSAMAEVIWCWTVNALLHARFFDSAMCQKQNNRKHK